MHRQLSQAAISLAALILAPTLTFAQDHAPAVAEHAADAASHASEPVGAIPTVKQGLYTAGTAIIVFLIVFAVLTVKVWPAITKGLDERAHKIKSEIEAAEMARAQAKDALEQYQHSLSQARAEAQKEIDKARQQAQIIGAELRQKADVELTHMREQALRDIDSAKRAAVAEVYAQGTQLATAMASKILERSVTPADTDKLFQDSLRQLEAARN